MATPKPDIDLSKVTRQERGWEYENHVRGPDGKAYAIGIGVFHSGNEATDRELLCSGAASILDAIMSGDKEAIEKYLK